MRLLVTMLLLALPLAEIAGFVVVGRAIGLLPTLGLVLAAFVLGAVVLRSLGLRTASRIRSEMEAGGRPGAELADGALKFLAGVLLLVPGFITDVGGLVLLVPAVRRAIRRRVGERMTFASFSFRRGPGGASSGRGTTIDLDEDDFARSGPRDAAGPPGDGPPRRLDKD